MTQATGAIAASKVSPWASPHPTPSPPRPTKTALWKKSAFWIGAGLKPKSIQKHGFSSHSAVFVISFANLMR